MDFSTSAQLHVFRNYKMRNPSYLSPLAPLEYECICYFDHLFSFLSLKSYVHRNIQKFEKWMLVKIQYEHLMKTSSYY